MVLVGGKGFGLRHLFIMCSQLCLSQELGTEKEQR
jgi:hypothetical protein